MFISKIIISEDFLGIKEEMINNFGIKKLRFFMPQNEFLLDDARAVEKESYIAETEEKIIVLMADSYRIEAQNFYLNFLKSLQKILNFLLWYLLKFTFTYHKIASYLRKKKS